MRSTKALNWFRCVSWDTKMSNWVYMDIQIVHTTSIKYQPSIFINLALGVKVDPQICVAPPLSKWMSIHVSKFTFGGCRCCSRGLKICQIQSALHICLCINIFLYCTSNNNKQLLQTYISIYLMHFIKFRLELIY